MCRGRRSLDRRYSLCIFSLSMLAAFVVLNTYHANGVASRAKTATSWSNARDEWLRSNSSRSRLRS